MINKRKPNVCCISFWSYPLNPRMRRELKVYVEKGYEIDIICPSLPNNFDYVREKSIIVHRIPIIRKRSGIKRYLFEYLSFTMLSAIYISFLFIKRNYTFFHVFCMPEHLVFTALIPKMFGKKILIDIQDPTREVFITKFGANHKTLIKIIELTEKLSCKFADGILIPNIGFLRAYAKRKIDTRKITIVMNSADEAAYSCLPRVTTKNEGNFTLVFFGQLSSRSGIEFAVRAMPDIIKLIPKIKLKVVGEGEEWERIDRIVEKLNLQKHVILNRKYLIGSKLVEFIIDSDLCIIPLTRNPISEIAISTRIFEATLIGLPIVISRLPAVEDYLCEDSVAYFNPDDKNDFVNTIFNLHKSPDRMKRNVEKAKKDLEKYGWNREKEKFLKVIEEICDAKI